ncbi:MAG: hypothetical protein JO149_06255, partial [Gammaproteobacteria bacterium]|nr:hypothetical protein [Gammaproteobacteria bacterium]
MSGTRDLTEELKKSLNKHAESISKAAWRKFISNKLSNNSLEDEIEEIVRSDFKSHFARDDENSPLYKKSVEEQTIIIKFIFEKIMEDFEKFDYEENGLIIKNGLPLSLPEEMATHFINSKQVFKQILNEIEIIYLSKIQKNNPIHDLKLALRQLKNVNYANTDELAQQSYKVADLMRKMQEEGKRQFESDKWNERKIEPIRVENHYNALIKDVLPEIEKLELNNEIKDILTELRENPFPQVFDEHAQDYINPMSGAIADLVRELKKSGLILDHDIQERLNQIDDSFFDARVEYGGDNEVALNKKIFAQFSTKEISEYIPATYLAGYSVYDKNPDIGMFMNNIYNSLLYVYVDRKKVSDDEASEVLESINADLKKVNDQIEDERARGKKTIKHPLIIKNDKLVPNRASKTKNYLFLNLDASLVSHYQNDEWIKPTVEKIQDKAKDHEVILFSNMDNNMQQEENNEAEEDINKIKNEEGIDYIRHIYESQGLEAEVKMAKPIANQASMNYAYDMALQAFKNIGESAVDGDFVNIEFCDDKIENLEMMRSAHQFYMENFCDKTISIAVKTTEIRHRHDEYQHVNHSHEVHEHQAYSASPEKLLHLLQELKKDYKELGRSTHIVQIAILMDSFKRIYNSGATAEVKIKKMVDLLEKAYIGEQKKVTNSFLGIVKEKPPNTFTKQINSHPKKYHYPRMLALMLETAYRNHPSLEPPKILKDEINHIVLPETKTLVYQRRLPEHLGNQYKEYQLFQMQLQKIEPRITANQAYQL